MKKFTDTQKKWALTATMIAALGCSVSFNSGTRSATLDLASESNTISDSVKVGNKVINVRLTSTIDQRTVIEQSPATDAEGKATFECDDCRTYIVKQPLGDGKAMLEAVTKAIKIKYAESSVEDSVMEAMDIRKDKSETARSKDKKSNHPEDHDRLSRDDQYSLLEDNGDKKCYRRNERREDLEIAKCYAEAMISTLKENGKRISPEVAVLYYEKNLSNDLAKGISKYTTSALDNEAYETAMATLQKIKRNLPERHAALYERVVFTAAKGLEKIALEARSLQRDQNTVALGNWRMAEMTNMDTSLRQILQQDLKDSSLGISGPKVYVNAYQIPSQMILDQFYGVNRQQQNISGNAPQVPGIVPAPGYGNNVQNGRVVNQNGNRQLIQVGNQIYQPITAPNTFGLDELNTLSNDIQNSPTADQVIEGRPAIVVLPANTSNGVEFGTPRAVTQQALQEAQRIRAQQGQRIWVQQ